MSEDLSIVQENFFYKFKDPNKEGERSNLTEKKAPHDYMMQICLETIIENFDKFKNNEIDLSEIINKKYPDNREILVEILKDATIKDFILSNIPPRIKNKKEYQDITENNFLQNFPLDITNEEYQRCTYLNQKLADGIIAEKMKNLPPEILQPYRDLMVDVINNYGTKPYLNGQIAAQSMNLIGSSTGITAIWSVCGTGQWGTENDVAYGNLIALAFDARTMAQIRDEAGEVGIETSATPDGFDAVSAILMLHARGDVYLFAGANFVKGRTLIETELPIALRNPCINRIIWVDTSVPNALDMIRNAALSTSEVKASQGQNKFDLKLEVFKNAIDYNLLQGKIIFDRQKTPEITVDSINQTITAPYLHGKTNQNIQSERSQIKTDTTSQVKAKGKNNLQNCSKDLTPSIYNEEPYISNTIKSKTKQSKKFPKKETFDLRFSEDVLMSRNTPLEPIQKSVLTQPTLEPAQQQPRPMIHRPLSKMQKTQSMTIKRTVKPLHKLKRALSLPADINKLQK